MKKQYFGLIILIVSFCLNACGQKTPIEKIEKIEMNLSAFGVESDDFPSVDAVIDFIKDSSSCVKSFYNPEKKGSSYSLDKDEMQEILNLLQISEVQKLKTEYKVSISDQPNSTTIIYTNKTKYVIKDYGLCGEGPLRKLYGIVYRIIL